MARRKGEITTRIKNRTHPFQVAICVPLGGLHGSYDIMYRWASRYDYVTTSSGLRDMRWCFRSREVADAFAADCGGERFDLPSAWVTPEPDWGDLPEHERRRREGAMRLGLDDLDATR